ncbi:MAG: serine/threonine protein kinase, partial [Pseudohongiellaceae bacterium]
MTVREDAAQALSGERFDAVLAEYLHQIDQGQQPDRQALLSAHPDLANDLAGYFEVQDRMVRLAHTDHGTHPTFGGGGTPEEPQPHLAGELLPPGSLLGQYRLAEVVGEGGMGRIYRATHLHLDRVLAIKVLAPRLSKDAALVQRFQLEARALARLSHPHIVSIHDMGSQGEMHYFVMEYVKGVNLRQLMATGEVSPERALSLVARICDALHYAHDAGIVHRDIKPENILIDEAGEPQVADFGLAKVLRGDVAPGNLTGTHVVLGTYNYMAPEQKRSARVDHRADIYAVGVMLYELLTGKLPAGNFPPPSHHARVTPGVDQLVLKALQAEPEHRYQSAHDLGSDIDIALAGESDAAAGPVPPRAAATGLRLLRIVDSRTDQLIGEMTAAWLRISMKENTLELRTWARPEIGVTTEAKLKKIVLSQLDGHSSTWTDTDDDALPGLGMKLPAHPTTIHVPADLAVRIDGSEVDITTSGMRSALHIESGTGTAKIRDHQGRLHVDRLEKGALRVSGLHSENFSLNTRAGRLLVSNLRFSRGHGTIHSDDGVIALGIDEDHCGFRFDARTLSGSLSCELLSESPTPGASFFSGTVGRGQGQLDIDSYSG